MADIVKLIAAICPDLYCDPDKRKEVKRILEENKDNPLKYQLAAKEAKMIKQDTALDSFDAKLSPLNKAGLSAPSSKYEITYDSASEGLEPVYFWILDFMNKMFGGSVEKIVDNFSSSPGSGHFSELGAKASRMQEEAMKLFERANIVLKSILNILYDLKEFKIRLELYEKAKSEDKMKRLEGSLALKQIWLDSVDFTKRQNTSIKAMAAQFDYVTLIDAFMAAESTEHVSKHLDLNERVKRIVIQRLAEYFLWLKESESELKKRYEIEKNYLRSQVSTLKLYAKWAKPYLKAAQDLANADSKNPSLVTAFNTVLFQLTLLGKNTYKPDGDVETGNLPKIFLHATNRKYYSIVIVDLKFRSIPQKVGQHYAFGGKADMSFSSFALNDEEFEILEDELSKDEMGEMLKLIQGATDQSLAQIQVDIDSFLDEKKTDNDEKKKKDEERRNNDVNPFTALFSFKKSEKKEDKKESKVKSIAPDSKLEQVIRSQAIIAARDSCLTVWDIYKRAHRMPAW